MSKAGSRILEGAREALAVAKGEAPAASITVNGHRYVPADRIEALEREVEELRAALESSITAIDDWLNIWAEELCDPARVAEAKARTNEFGTLWYIAKTQEANRKALSAHPRKPSEAEGREG